MPVTVVVVAVELYGTVFPVSVPLTKIFKVPAEPENLSCVVTLNSPIPFGTDNAVTKPLRIVIALPLMVWSVLESYDVHETPLLIQL